MAKMETTPRKQWQEIQTQARTQPGEMRASQKNDDEGSRVGT